MKTSSPLITDTQSLTSARSRFGRLIPVYDDGWGALFIHRDSSGISGIVRARTWEDAYSICEDEFFPAGDDESGEEMQRIESMADGEEKDHAQACWDEAFGYRNNTRMMPDSSLSSIYAKDLNGDTLDVLTPALLAELEITLTIEENDLASETAREVERMKAGGMEEISRAELVNRAAAAGYRINPDMCFNYVNIANEITHKARSIGWKHIASGMNAFHVETPHDTLHELQEIRHNCFVFQNGRVWEL